MTSEPVVDEGLEELNGHLLGQTRLMQLQLRTHHDDGPARIVDSLAEEVLPETALLAFQRIGEGLQGPVVGALEHATPAAVVEEGVDGLLKHPLLVAHDDFRGAQLEKLLQPVVAVDDPPVQIVQI